jgi:hypothetical protein
LLAVLQLLVAKQVPTLTAAVLAASPQLASLALLLLLVLLLVRQPLVTEQQGST